MSEGNKIDLDEIDAKATIHFGLPFGAGRMLTPKQYRLLTKEYNNKRRNEELPIAQLTSLLYNINRNKGRALTAEDFMTCGVKVRRPKMSESQIKAIFKGLVTK